MELDLGQIRQELDTIDKEMIALFSRRMELVSQVAAYKKEKNMPILDSGREAQILDKVGREAGEELAEYAKTVYQTLLQVSKAYQAKILQRSENEEERA